MGQVTKKTNSEHKKTVRRILLADDEQTFRESTAELLRKEGYHCDCVPDAFSAIEMLKQNSYDLLIADIKMPGNPDLEMVKQLSEFARGISVILVTAYPSQKSAIEAVGLPVASYMIKPIDFEELKKKIAEVIKQKNLFRSAMNNKERLAVLQKHIKDIEESLKARNQKGFSASVKSFLDFSLINMRWAMSDVKNLTYMLTNEQPQSTVCNLLNCPRLEELTKGLLSTVRVLEKTKSSFKSKELGQLRIKLEQLLKKVKKI
jgi:CheY-like chemotaxis protein